MTVLLYGLGNVPLQQEILPLGSTPTSAGTCYSERYINRSTCVRHFDLKVLDRKGREASTKRLVLGPLLPGSKCPERILSGSGIQ